MNMTIKQMLSLLLMLLAIGGLLSVLPEHQAASLGEKTQDGNQPLVIDNK